jgi:hypothetical protein
MSTFVMTVLGAADPIPIGLQLIGPAEVMLRELEDRLAVSAPNAKVVSFGINAVPNDLVKAKEKRSVKGSLWKIMIFVFAINVNIICRSRKGMEVTAKNNSFLDGSFERLLCTRIWFGSHRRW